MTRAQVNKWVEANALRIAGWIFGLGVIWGVTTAAQRDLQREMESKADQVAVDTLRSEVRRNKVAADSDRVVIRRLLCRIPDVSHDSGCDGYRQ